MDKKCGYWSKLKELIARFQFWFWMIKILILNLFLRCRIENLTLPYSQRNERFPIFFLRVIQKCVCLWLNKRTFSAARAHHTQFHLPKICQRSVLLKYKLLPWDISIFTGNLDIINFNVNNSNYYKYNSLIEIMTT